MKQIKKILCAIDFSYTSDEALDIAIQLSEKYTSTLHLLYVLPRPTYYDWTLTGMSTLVLEDYFEKSKAEVDAKIKTLAEMISKEHPFVDLKTEISDEMDASQTILNKSKESKVDLIILGSHGRRGMNRILMGSVAESVMRHADCAVLIYKSEPKEN